MSILFSGSTLIIHSIDKSKFINLVLIEKCLKTFCQGCIIHVTVNVLSLLDINLKFISAVWFEKRIKVGLW